MTISNMHVNMVIIDFFPSKGNGLVSLSGNMYAHAYSKVSKPIHLVNKYNKY